jgi:hypothetical protein
MILCFVDETGDTKSPEYFGLCCAMINSNFYSKIKKDFQSILLEEGWDPNIEFKGSCLFSASRGDTKIPVDKRVNIAKRLLALNTSKQNARMKFAYLTKDSKNPREDYLKSLPKLIDKILPNAKEKGGKNILYLVCDQRDDIKAEDIRKAIEEVVTRNRYTLLEDVVCCRSSFHTVGILYADIVGYLASRIDTIKVDIDLDLFADIRESNGRIKKLRSSKTLLGLIKKLDYVKVQ